MTSTGIAATPESSRSPTVTLLENLPDGILMLDERGVISYANRAAERLFGAAKLIVAKPFRSLLAEPFAGRFEEILGSLGPGEPQSMLGERQEVVGLRPDGSSVALELSLSEVRVGDIRSLIAVTRDIGEQKRAEARLRQMADQDTLTGTVNRISFEHALIRHVEYAERYGSGGSVLALGIDTFKYVNEALGVAAGDQILAELAELIRRRLRKTDVLARVGGDVFGMLVHGSDREQAIVLAEELLAMVRRHAFVINGEGIRITMSAGVTSLQDRTAIGAELLAEAESAMNRAKEAGRDRVLGFDQLGRGEIEERRAWTERVRQATERGLFILASQPIVDLRSGSTTQHEILLRMREDGGGLVEPASFLATAERFGLITGIDRWVTQQAIRLIEAHNREGRELLLEVNLSGKTMTDPKFPDEIKHQLTRSGIDPASLVFEVTETAAVADMEHARRFALNLSRIGCRFALDDFGAGYASFYYLKHLPISYLKIDGEFVRDLPASRANQLIVKALVEVCSGLGIKTVAEFVGDQATLEMVSELGVDFGQGYHLGMPEPVSALRPNASAQDGRVTSSSGITNDS